MKLAALKPILWTNDFDATLEFYTELLGFQVREKNDEWGWAAIHRDAVEIMIARPNAHAPFEGPKFTGSFYFNTDDVDEIWQFLQGKVNICYELEAFEWNMREFAIYDNNGYLLQFGQEINQL